MQHAPVPAGDTRPVMRPAPARRLQSCVTDQVRMYAHTHTRTQMHAHSRTRTHIHLYMHNHIRIPVWHVRKHSMLTGIQIYSHKHTHTHLHTHIQTHMLICFQNKRLNLHGDKFHTLLTVFRFNIFFPTSASCMPEAKIAHLICLLI